MISFTVALLCITRVWNGFFVFLALCYLSKICREQCKWWYHSFLLYPNFQNTSVFIPLFFFSFFFSAYFSRVISSIRWYPIFKIFEVAQKKFVSGRVVIFVHLSRQSDELKSSAKSQKTLFSLPLYFRVLKTTTYTFLVARSL